MRMPKKQLNTNLETIEKGEDLSLVVDKEVEDFMCLIETYNATIMEYMYTWQKNIFTIWMHVEEAMEVDTKDIMLGI